jgi:hypothetical protein
MSQHLQKIFDVWDGNAEAMASDIDEKGVTVRQWRNRGDIPARSAQLKIIKAAFEKNGTVLCLEDFLPAEVRAELPGHGAALSAAAAEASAANGEENIGANNAPFAEAPEEGPTPPSSGAFPPTCSETNAPSRSSPDSPTSSSAPEAEAA